MIIERIIEWSARNRLFVFIGVGFALVWSISSMKNIPLDAIPDLSDTQVIIYVKWDRPPQLIEDQITYPIISSLLGTPKVKDIRGFSDYGYSFIYVIFEDGTDIYWARSRVLEYLSKVISQIPEDAKVEIGPDATGLGWVFMYALVDENGRYSIEELRTFQDWYLKYELQSVKGVAEVATIGGFVKQYQVVVNPNNLLAYNISISDLVKAIRNSNKEVGARIIEISGTEFMITVKGYIKSIEEIGEIVVKYKNGTPVKVKNIARVEIGPDIKRGVAELNGQGEVVGGIVISRHKENALKVIERVKKRLQEIQFPEGVKLVITYDRSELILKAVDTLKRKLIEEMLVVSIIILIFLLHIPSAIIPIITLPIAVLISFIPMRYIGVTANIMSLGGIAIAIGAMVDAAIVMVENAHKKLSAWEEGGRKEDYHQILINSIKEVGTPSFFSLLIIAVSFIPIFALEEIEGRLFKPLAYTKNLSMLFAAILAITLDPAIRMSLTRLDYYNFRPIFLSKIINTVLVGKILSEEKHPISRFLFKIYTPVIDFTLKRPYLIVSSAFLTLAISTPVFLRLGKEFLPPLNEGSILYMPTTFPGISITEATKLLQIQDKILKTFPEVLTVFGKAGRAETSTDPAPLSMMETVVLLKPQNEWRHKERWYCFLPEFLKGPFRLIWPDRISWEELIQEMDQKLQLPGQVNAWSMPIKVRIDMLSTGIRTPMGIKIYGDDLKKIEEIGREIEKILPKIKGTRSVYADKTVSGYFLDIKPKREEIARYGLTIEDVQMIIMSAIGGQNISYTVEGRERYPINIRYLRDYREDIEAIRRIYIPTPNGYQIPLSQIADIEFKMGPGTITNENGRLAGFVHIDVVGRDIGSYVEEAKKVLRENLKLPAGYSLSFTGQYEYMERVKDKMMVVVPLTIFIIFVLLYLNTRSYVKTFIVMLAVPFSLTGVAWTLFLLDYNISLAVWCGVIALLGVDAETGIFMLLYLDLAYEDMKKNKGKMMTLEDLKNAIHHGAVKRIRPKLMTALTLVFGLLPIMWSQTHEIGADVMKKIAAPMLGGIISSFLMELIVYPSIYFIWKSKEIAKR